MPRHITIQADFTAGELSPRLQARVELDSYKHGVKTLENAYCLPHGGARRRLGTKYIGTLFDSSQKAKLIPFTYSRTISYVIVINGGKIEFLKDGKFVESEGVRVQLDSPWSETHLEDIRYAQIGSQIYLVHPTTHPRVIVTTSDTEWTISEVEFSSNAVTDYWYENRLLKFKILSGTTPFKTGDKFTVTGAKTVTWVGTQTGNGAVYGTERLNGAAEETWTITCVYADSFKQEWKVEGATSGELTAQWYSGNYPKAISLYEQRLYFAGTNAAPQTIWGSVIGDYTNLTLGPLDNDGVQFTIASNTYDEIVHLNSARHLLPLTYGGEFSMFGGVTSGITPSSVKITGQTFHGSNYVAPFKVGNEVIFVQRGGKKVRAISYSVAEDVNVAPDITILAEHITGAGVIDASFAQSPDYCAWMVREDGVLLSLTRFNDFDQTGWGRQVTKGKFENVATIPTRTSDATYFVVERTINGETARFIEYFDYDEDVYSDCYLTLTAETATNVWDGLDHLEGEDVTVVADGNVHPIVTVINGSITLQYNVTKIEVGLPYITKIELLHPEIPLRDGTSQGRFLSISEAILKLQDTVGLTVNDEEIPFRNFGDPMDTQVSPFSGDKKIHTNGWNREENLKIEQRIPKPFTLLGVVIKVTANDL